MELLHRHRVFATSDIDEGQQFVSNIWERNKSTITEGCYGIRWNQLDFDKVSFSYIEHDCAVDLEAQGPLSDHFRLFFHKGGSMEHAVHGRSFVSDRGHTVVHSPGMDLHLGVQPLELLLVSIDGAFVRQAMAQRFKKLPPFAGWLDVLPPSANLQSLRSMISWLVGEMERVGSPRPTPANRVCTPNAYCSACSSNAWRRRHRR